MANDLRRDFPRTATVFEARFASEEDWISAGWGGDPSCARCDDSRVSIVIRLNSRQMAQSVKR